MVLRVTRDSGVSSVSVRVPSGGQQIMRLQNIAKLRATLLDMKFETQEPIFVEALEAAAVLVEAEAKRLVPVKTGDLKRSIVVHIPTSAYDVETGRFQLGRGKNALVQVGLLKELAAWRGHFTEFGTRFANAFPFLRPALDTQGRAAIEAVMRKLRKSVPQRALKAAKKNGALKK